MSGCPSKPVTTIQRKSRCEIWGTSPYKKADPVNQTTHHPSNVPHLHDNRLSSHRIVFPENIRGFLIKPPESWLSKKGLPSPDGQ